MSVLREPDLVTVEDFWALVGDGRKADLIDGVIYMASPDTPRNNETANFVQFLLDGCASAWDQGTVFASRVAFVLSEIRAPEPDVAFVSKARAHIIAGSKVLGAPDIAVEIVSRDSRTRDYVEKKRLYEEAGVPEYWLVDTQMKRAEFYRLGDGGYSLVPLEGNQVFRSQALPGFWLKVDWLFQQPLPNKLECLQQILTGDPEG